MPIVAILSALSAVICALGWLRDHRRLRDEEAFSVRLLACLARRERPAPRSAVEQAEAIVRSIGRQP